MGTQFLKKFIKTIFLLTRGKSKLLKITVIIPGQNVGVAWVVALGDTVQELVSFAGVAQR